MTKITMQFDHGDEAKDQITGFTGIITGFARYITGCDQYCLSPQGLDKDGKPQDGRWFDENRIEMTRASVVSIRPVQADKPTRSGGAPSGGSEQARAY